MSGGKDEAPRYLVPTTTVTSGPPPVANQLFGQLCDSLGMRTQIQTSPGSVHVPPTAAPATAPSEDDDLLSQMKRISSKSNSVPGSSDRLMTKAKTRRIGVPFAAISRKTDFLLAAFFSSIHVLLTTIVYHYVPEPYMDEIFHICQTRAYCDGNYTWNPLITTPPALYIVSMPLCGYERYINSILIFFAIPAFCRFRRMFLRENVWLTVSIVAALPILLTSSLLFYTDLLSLAAVLWAFSIANPLISAGFFLLSICTRQTNIIWAACYAFSVLASRIDGSRGKVENLKLLILSAFSLWPFIGLAAGFLGFLYWNNYQIVLGDAKAHKPKFHVAQLFYAIAFSAAHSWPQMLPGLLTLLGSLTEPRALLLQATVAILVYNFSYDHPYLLADNRHFTFYIWKRFLALPSLRCSFSPLYVLSATFLNKATWHIHVFHKILFAVGCFFTLVPAHLFEMRYYIIPYVIWRLSATIHRHKSLLLMELASQIAIFSVVFYLFLFRSFEWPNEPGVRQRFMF
uniref:Dol-P-Glc:Glc(2)Man(9)GlcNAc(2)-PP-Dol alpha-1,2-glucosyltransferase n=1 Tax=Caenorhabditis tropicalis TaxID=1561998 RepID=A0A1I7TR18_9PELO